MNVEEKTEKLTQFITDNKLNFNLGIGSGLNSACVTLCGYALYLGDLEGDMIDETDVINAVDKSFIKIPVNRTDYVSEIKRVFDYAEDNLYGEWWKHPSAKKQYKF